MLNDLQSMAFGLIEMAQDKENAPDWALGLKLGEETGEVQSVLLYENGFLQHKEFDEDVMHEVADVFNVCTAILAKHYSHLTPSEIMVRFNLAVHKKGLKYAKILEGSNGD